MCFLKLKKYSEARDASKAALVFDEKNEKGLFRLAQAYMGIGENEDAIKQFEKVVEMNAENKEATNQIALCKQKIKENKNREKAMYSKMMAAFST